MGLQTFIKKSLIASETISKKIKKEECSDCGRNKDTFFRNTMNTLECMCGKKFYHE